MKIKSLVLAFVIFSLSSCDTYNYIYYTVNNETDDSVLIRSTFYDNYFDTQATDSLILLKGHQIDTLFTFLQISTSVYNPEENLNMTYIKNITIKRLPDYAVIKTDASLRKNWLFNETDKNSAIMMFFINESDF